MFMGYLFDEEKTRSTIDPDGWLHSGDVARIDSDGFIFITGRIKGEGEEHVESSSSSSSETEM